MSTDSLVGAGDALSLLGDVLIRTQVLEASQWQALLDDEADATDNLESLLGKLRDMPSWWSQAEESSPAVTTHQQRQILNKFPNKLDTLEHVLRLNDYLVLDKLGKGGMGVVYRAWDLKEGRLVAIKRAKDGGVRIRKRFQREIRIQQRLQHPSINRFLAVEKGHGRNILVLEYINGRTLVDEVKARQRIPWPEVCRWAIDLLGALEHAHQKGVIHRDIKPANVMTHQMSTGIIAKLLDMGLAKCSEDVFGPGATEADDQTRANQLMGSYEYMPPEQWK